ncbi:MAG: 4Fe-4S dicluster domain-containing protein [Marmoricola sp.]
MYSPAAIALMAQAKRILDPDNILNPGVLVDPAPADVDLRLEAQMKEFKPALRMVTTVARLLTPYTGAPAWASALADNTGTGAVMCPSYTASRDEKDSTRGRAHVLQEVVRGELSVSDPAVADALDLCLSCKGCSRDCPTGVDMAAYKSEILHQKYKASCARRLVRSGSIAESGQDHATRLCQRDDEEQVRRPADESWCRGRSAPSPALVFHPALPKEQPQVDQADVWIWADSFTDCFAADAGRDAVASLKGRG